MKYFRATTAIGVAMATQNNGGCAFNGCHFFVVRHVPNGFEL